ncbi:LacI family DNA-binding transcriptional regulator [Paenibacillus mesotrionivorans]|uniref:LacI family DNA-binding transcriptional regulator n=1 Tax=Paenibacillus mesotrionivorans TaxID=3160968 RepID=A0ACC7PB11_9BACL
MKQITVYDIAHEARVSVATVSRVLNGTAPVKASTRERVLEVINKHQFQPNALARSLIKKESGMIGMIMPDIGNPFFPEVFLGAEKEARARGYAIFLCNTMGEQEKESEYLALLQEKRVDGIVFLGGRINQVRSKAELARELVDCASRLPVVLVNGNMPRVSLPRVITDEAAGFRLAAQHLIDLGHRELRFIGGEGSVTATVQKVQALKAVMEENGLPFRPDTVLYGGFSIACGRSLMQTVLAEENRPTAVMCVNDSVAVGAVKAALEAGVDIPGELSVTGFDDTLLATSITPELTTVSQNSHALGEQAVQLLHQMISGEKGRKLTVLEPKLICRQSTGPVEIPGI